MLCFNGWNVYLDHLSHLKVGGSTFTPKRRDKARYTVWRPKDDHNLDKHTWFGTKIIISWELVFFSSYFIWLTGNARIIIHPCCIYRLLGHTDDLFSESATNCLRSVSQDGCIALNTNEKNKGVSLKFAWFVGVFIAHVCGMQKAWFIFVSLMFLLLSVDVGRWPT